MNSGQSFGSEVTETASVRVLVGPLRFQAESAIHDSKSPINLTIKSAPNHLHRARMVLISCPSGRLEVCTGRQNEP
jgi:hypothetical protein